MINQLTVSSFLSQIDAEHEIIRFNENLISLLPINVDFESDCWNVLEWVPRKGGAKYYNLYFDKFKNNELKILIKLYLLNKRNECGMKAGSMSSIILSLLFLDEALQARPIKVISNATFEVAAELIEKKVKKTAASRSVDFLVSFGGWLLSDFGFRINFSNQCMSYYQHGRKSTDAERDAKLIDSRVIASLINCRHKPELNEKDEFYILIFVLFVGTGFRINEVATLPKDCIVKDGNLTSIRYYPLKVPKNPIKFIHPKWAEAVEDAINRLTKITDNGRKIAAEIRKSPGLDWSAIIQDEHASRYFFAKFCHEWTANPRNNMFSKNGVWFEKEKRYIDIVNLIKEAGSQKKLSKQYGTTRHTISYLLKAYEAAQNDMLPPRAKGNLTNARVSWDTDSRVISILQFEKHCGLGVKQKFRNIINSILIDARDNYQLNGLVFPSPVHDEILESKFKRVINPVVTTSLGKPLLQPEDALLVTATYELTDTRETKINNYKLITAGDISRWFCGVNRSYGTKNREDSCFSRLGIIDPKSGDIAKFSSHDIRHWLTTYLLEGGMPSDQVALLMNRTPSQNDTYDQTSSKTRLNNMREAIRSGSALGHISDVYHNLAEYSRDDAEKYLGASTLQLNLMPHGGCTLNWGMKACKNHNGYFNSEDGLCENLCIDVNNQDTKYELDRLLRESNQALSIIPEESPQYHHYQNIQRNLNGLLGVSNE